jgi:nucleotide-binding universal stress UspA family protein
MKMYEDPHLKTVLVPLDGSDFSFKAAKYAIKIATMGNADIICLHSIVNLPYTEYATAGFVINQYIEDMKKQAGEWYNKVNSMAEKVGIKVTGETIIDVMSVADSIIGYAEKNNIDLIVMGTKGMTGIKKFMLGSVASGVISHARCPVLVVR